ncbi:hypothetical protein LNI89_09205 [Tenacibaculum dicentrarchi]|nr:hypothetical protein [Tenacibaculum dicentrarchi]MCD8420656.1 hypothetical protein [Tenacibaculum dicentrarchi]
MLNIIQLKRLINMLVHNLSNVSGRSLPVGRPSGGVRPPISTNSGVTGGALVKSEVVVDFVSNGPFEASDFLNLVSPAADALFPGGSAVVSLASGLIAKDTWASVEPKMRFKGERVVSNGLKRYLQNDSLPFLERLNLYDAYLSYRLMSCNANRSRYKHSNSLSGNDLIAGIISDALESFRGSIPESISSVSSVLNVKDYGLKKFDGRTVYEGHGWTVEAFVYSKSDVSPVKSKKKIVPFNPDAGVASDSEKDNGFVKKYWWLLFIPVILYAVYKGFELNNNKKKRR